MAQETRLKSINFGDAISRSWLARSGGITVFVGKNGAGKSRLLTIIAEILVDLAFRPLLFQIHPIQTFKK